MKKISMICLAAGMACAATAVAKPPAQLMEQGVLVRPVQIAPAKLVNGKVVYGEWQDYNPVSTRANNHAEFYSFDCYEGYSSGGEYVNLANAGAGLAIGDTRYPGDNTCGLGGSRWFFGWSFSGSLVVDDVTANGCFDQGGNLIDGADMGFIWPVTQNLVINIFTSDNDASCAITDPLTNTYYSGVGLNYGSLAGSTSFYYFTNTDDYVSNGIAMPQPAPGGSYLAFMTDGTYLITTPGAQFMRWGTGDGNSNTPFRPGVNATDGWDDWDPDGSLTGNCTTWDFGTATCPQLFGVMMGFITNRCPGDINNDGFVNGDDYDSFASAFDVADKCADFNGDGFVNGDDYDGFASYFDAGCSY